MTFIFDGGDASSCGGQGNKPNKSELHRPAENELRYADAFERTGHGSGARSAGEVYPVGMFNDAPAADDPIYYSTSRAKDGKTMMVGPFQLTADQMRGWSQSISSSDLDDLVESRQIRPATALTVKSAQFQTMLKLLESGQTPSEDMVQRFIPGDLQRVIARNLKSSS